MVVGNCFLAHSWSFFHSPGGSIKRDLKSFLSVCLSSEWRTRLSQHTGGLRLCWPQTPWPASPRSPAYCPLEMMGTPSSPARMPTWLVWLPSSPAPPTVECRPATDTARVSSCRRRSSYSTHWCQTHSCSSCCCKSPAGVQLAESPQQPATARRAGQPLAGLTVPHLSVQLEQQPIFCHSAAHIRLSLCTCHSLLLVQRWIFASAEGRWREPAASGGPEGWAFEPRWGVRGQQHQQLSESHPCHRKCVHYFISPLVARAKPLQLVCRCLWGVQLSRILLQSWILDQHSIFH